MSDGGRMNSHHHRILRENLEHYLSMGESFAVAAERLGQSMEMIEKLYEREHWPKPWPPAAA